MALFHPNSGQLFHHITGTSQSTPNGIVTQVLVTDTGVPWYLYLNKIKNEPALLFGPSFADPYSWNPDPGIFVNRILILIPDPALDPDSDDRNLKIYINKKNN